MLRIGEFSRLGRVSVRMLRHYDDLGLLKPSYTDHLTHYRYYAADQLPRLNRILALQDLGFSLQQIGRLLDENLPADELRGMLKLKRAEIEQGLQAEHARLVRLESRIQQLDDSSSQADYDVVLRPVAPELVATRRAVVPDDEGVQLLFQDLEAYVAGIGHARADKPPFAIYHDAEYRDRDIDVEAAVPLQFAIPGNDWIAVRELAGMRCAACVLHTGSYGSLHLAYNALLSWIDANGYGMSGPIREVYVRYGAEELGFGLPPTHLTADPDRYVTELQLAVEKNKEA